MITSDFLIESIGTREYDVYDIEVDDTHNFFANDILVHNSIYYHIEPFINEYKKSHPNASITELTKYAHEFEENVIAPVIQQTIDEFTDELNALDPSACGAKMEIIADTVIFLAKKKYLARIRESEATVFPENHPKLKAMGVELVKSSTALFTRNRLPEAIDIMFDGSNNDLLEWLDIVKQEFIKQPITDIAQVSSVSNLSYDLTKDTVPINSRAAMYYNNYIKNNGLENKHNLIQSNEKIKIVRLKYPHPFADIVKKSNGSKVIPNVFAFNDDTFGEVLRDYIDWDEQFNKAFIAPLEIMTAAINFKTQRKAPALFDF